MKGKKSKSEILRGERLHANLSRNHPNAQPDPEKSGATGAHPDNGTLRNSTTRVKCNNIFLRHEIMDGGGRAL